jgi:hypothetical protein
LHLLVIFLVVLVKDRLEVPAHLILNDGTNRVHVCNVISMLDVDVCEKDDYCIEKVKDDSEN